MKVYDFEGIPNPARVRIALAEKGMTDKGMTDKVEFVPVNVPEAEHKQEAFLKKNPSGLVPALELEDGTIISVCTAITEYIDGAYGERTLAGKGAKQRAIIYIIQRRGIRFTRCCRRLFSSRNTRPRPRH